MMPFDPFSQVISVAQTAMVMIKRKVVPMKARVRLGRSASKIGFSIRVAGIWIIQKHIETSERVLRLYAWADIVDWNDRQTAWKRQSGVKVIIRLDTHARTTSQ